VVILPQALGLEQDLRDKEFRKTLRRKRLLIQ